MKSMTLFVSMFLFCLPVLADEYQFSDGNKALMCPEVTSQLLEQALQDRKVVEVDDIGIAHLMYLVRVDGNGDSLGGKKDILVPKATGCILIEL